MKGRSYTLTFALVVFASVALAKPYGGMEDSPRERGAHPPMEQLEALGLSAEQKAAIEELRTTFKAARKSLASERRALFKQLHDRDIQGLSVSDIDSLSAEFGRISAQGMRQRLEMKVAVAQILTPEQQAKMAELRQRKREEMRDKRGQKRHDDF